MMKLQNAEIVGFFSLPSPLLAEHNPAAYNAAMAAAPAGAGSCANCGNGIRHHVVIRDENGVQHFIGTDCAVRVGCSPEQIRDRMTDTQRAARDARIAAAQADSLKAAMEREEQARIALAHRREQVGDILDMLRNAGGDFHRSLAEQLEHGPLSCRQAYYAAKATSETGRRNKKNAAAWDDVEMRCQEEIN